MMPTPSSSTTPPCQPVLSSSHATAVSSSLTSPMHSSGRSLTPSSRSSTALSTRQSSTGSATSASLTTTPTPARISTIPAFLQDLRYRHHPAAADNNGTLLGGSGGIALTNVSTGYNNGNIFWTVPPCCFTGYDTVKFMSMDMLDCTHYASFVMDGRGGRGEFGSSGPMDWLYGIKLSYGLPESGCDRCKRSGGVCGFDTETETSLCLCSATLNATRKCGPVADQGEHITVKMFHLCTLFVIVIASVVL